MNPRRHESMNPNIDTENFTDRQKVIFLTTSVKSIAKILRRELKEKAALEAENEELKKKIAYDKVHLERLGRSRKILIRKNRELNRFISK